jgi:hypothetical protein
MSGSDQNGKHQSATIWFLCIIAFILVAATMWDQPITVAASDNPPSISTPVKGFNEANGMSMGERRAAIDAQTPDVHPDSQIFYRGGNLPP